MATGSKHEAKRRGIITEPIGDALVAFGPHHINGAPVVRITLLELDFPINPTAVALDLIRARELRNTLNAVIGLITEEARL